VEDDWSQCAWIAVFDDYITDCPGYAGRVMSVLWGAAPDTCSVFTWDDRGNLVHESSFERSPPENE